MIQRMMVRTVMVTLLSVMASQQLYTLPPSQRIAVLDIEASDDDPVLLAVGVTIKSTIELAFRLMNQYSVVDPLADPETSAPDQLILGRAYRDSRGSFRFVMQVYNPASDTILFTGEFRADSLFDVFDVADEATIAVLEALTTRTIRFGSLRIVADDHLSPLTIEIQGQEVAHGIGDVTLERVVAGVHRVRVSQSRASGREIIADEDLVITAGESLVMPVAVPLLTRVEKNHHQIPAHVWERVRYDPIRGARTIASYSVPPLAGSPEAYLPAPVRAAVASFTASATSFYAHGTHRSWHPDGRSVMATRDISIDGDPGGWSGIPSIAVVPRIQRESIGDSVPEYWKIALSPDDATLFLFMRTTGGPVRRQLWYRFFFTPAGAVRYTREPFQMDIRPTTSFAVAESEWWPGPDRHVDFTLPSRNHVADGWMEARVDLRDRAFATSFTMGGEVLRGSDPYPRFADIPGTEIAVTRDPMRRVVRLSEVSPSILYYLQSVVTSDPQWNATKEAERGLTRQQGAPPADRR